MDDERGIEETWADWNTGNRSVAVGAVLVGVLIACLAAYLLRRFRQPN